MRILKIKSLPNKSESWIDRDFIMLHSCFQIFEDFVELEKGISDLNPDIYSERIEEMNSLYNWWKVRRERIFPEKGKESEDNEMLLRLINIRDTLWT